MVLKNLLKTIDLNPAEVDGSTVPDGNNFIFLKSKMKPVEGKVPYTVLLRQKLCELTNGILDCNITMGGGFKNVADHSRAYFSCHHYELEKTFTGNHVIYFKTVELKPKYGLKWKWEVKCPVCQDKLPAHSSDVWPDNKSKFNKSESQQQPAPSTSQLFVPTRQVSGASLLTDSSRKQPVSSSSAFSAHQTESSHQDTVGSLATDSIISNREISLVCGRIMKRIELIFNETLAECPTNTDDPLTEMEMKKTEIQRNFSKVYTEEISRYRLEHSNDIHDEDGNETILSSRAIQTMKIAEDRKSQRELEFQNPDAVLENQEARNVEDDSREFQEFELQKAIDAQHDREMSLKNKDEGSLKRGIENLDVANSSAKKAKPQIKRPPPIKPTKSKSSITNFFHKL